MIASLVCLLGTLAALLVLHKAASSFALLIVAFGAVIAFSHALLRLQPAWLWLWLLWLMAQGLLFLGMGTELLRLSMEQWDSRGALLFQLGALCASWLCFWPRLAGSDFLALLVVLLFLSLYVFALAPRARSDLNLIGSVLLYILLYQVSNVTLMTNAYARRSPLPTEFAKLCQALWVLFLPSGIFSTLALLLQLLISLVLFVLGREQAAYFASGYAPEKVREHEI